MKNKIIFLISIIMVILFCAACGNETNQNKNNKQQSTESDNNAEEKDKLADSKHRIWIMGDSLASSNHSFGGAGWGEMLEKFSDGSIEVRNSAQGGASSSSYIETGTFDMVIDELNEGDTVIIQFGHNDSYYEDRFTNPYMDSDAPGSFKNILKYKYVKQILDKKCNVVFATSVMSFYFENEHTVMEMTYEPWVIAMRELAKECNKDGMKVNIIDTYQLTKDKYEEIGAAEAQRWHMDDRVHYTVYGATNCAEMIANGLNECGIEGFSNMPTSGEILDEIGYN